MESTPSSVKKIVLLDDQVSVRELLRLFFERDMPECRVVGEADNAADGLRVAHETQPDVIVSDLFFSDMPALPLISSLLQGIPQARVVVFSRSMEPSLARQLVAGGVSGIALKNESLAKLRTALLAVMSGGCYITEVLERSLYVELSGRKHLTEREIMVLRLIAEGLATKEVGDRLSISVKTAEKHREKIMAKLNLHDVVRLTRYAIRNGIAAL